MFVYKFRQWSKFLRELFFSRELLQRIVKNRENPKNLNPEKISGHGMSAGATFLAFMTVCCVTIHARVAQGTQWHDLF